MRFLIDESLSYRVADLLRDAGHDAVHAVRDLGLGGATDEVLMDRARREERVLVTADTDFAQLLALGGHELPSLVLFRRGRRRPSEQAHVLLANLASIGEALEVGAVVVVEVDRIRVRTLPIG